MSERKREARLPAPDERVVFDLSPVAELVAHDYHAAPGASVAAAIRRGGTWRVGAGVAGTLTREPGSPRVVRTTVYDLASVTKPLTALTLARLEKQGILRRSERLGDVLPELS